jgi:hypothetical protein
VRFNGTHKDTLMQVGARLEGTKKVRSGRRVGCAVGQTSTAWASEQGIGGKVEETLWLLHYLMRAWEQESE